MQPDRKSEFMRSLIDAHDAFGRAMLADLTAKPATLPAEGVSRPETHAGSGEAHVARQRAISGRETASCPRCGAPAARAEG